MLQRHHPETSLPPAARLHVRRASKRYGEERALDEAHLEVAAGEIHALVGENGAGKSTLIRLLAGVETPDVFDAALDGEALHPSSPADAHAMGLRFVHQELNVVPALSVAENVFLGRPYPRHALGLIAWRRLHGEARGVLERLGVTHIEPSMPMYELRPGDAMLVALARAFVTSDVHAAPPRVYVFDEPTASLSRRETELLFRVIRELKMQDVSVLYVSHRMDEILELTDRITVLRDGSTVDTFDTATTTRDTLIHAMTGRTWQPFREPKVADEATADVTLRAEGLRNVHLDDVSLDLVAGEITVLTGLAGSGRSELLRALMGVDPLEAGRVTLDGRTLIDAPRQRLDPHVAWRAGVAYVPEERRSEALWMSGDVRSNVLLPHLQRVTRFGMARRNLERREAAQWTERVDLRSRGLHQVVRELSGGNQQKVVFARALAASPRVLLLDEPTRGVDVGAKNEMYDLIRDAAARGTAILAVTSDLEEVFTLADRVLVLARGRLVLDARAATLDRAAILTASFDEGAVAA